MKRALFLSLHFISLFQIFQTLIAGVLGFWGFGVVWVASEPAIKTLHKRSHAAHDLRPSTHKGGEDLAVAKGDRDPFSDVRAKECDEQFVHAF